ncbi:MAG: hypothetical protein ACPGSB_08770 [Opitutales bacterium]
MIRFLISFLVLCCTSGISLLAQSVPVDSPVPAMGPFQLPKQADFAGKWIRSDGQYRIEVEFTDKGVTAKYFNPAAIRVESAVFEGEGETLALTIVLRDKGYPGSTYQLRYVPEHDIIAGYYTIPDQQPTQVYFLRNTGD